MKIHPMGDYHVWHCDWCDSTNYTIWTRLEIDGLACAACQQRVSAPQDGVPTFNRLRTPATYQQSCSL